MLMCGIYKITNIIDNKTYYGSSLDINRRWTKHKRQLLLGTHPNPYLQAAYALYGSACFKYNVLFICSPKDLLFYEQRVLDCYWDAQQLCYNISKSSLAPMTGRTHTQQAKDKISKVGHLHPFYGKHHTTDATERNRVAHLGRHHSQETKNKISYF